LIAGHFRETTGQDIAKPVIIKPKQNTGAQFPIIPYKVTHVWIKVQRKAFER
jgi:hypothetical protein